MEPFRTFVNSIEINEIKKGSSSCNIICHLKDETTNPFGSTTGINRFVIKLVFISEINEGWISMNRKEIFLTKKDIFDNEVQIQREVFERTSSSPLCPVIFYDGILTIEQINILRSAKDDTNDHVNDMLNEITDEKEKIDDIGVIVMEYLYDYQEMFTLIEEIQEQPADDETISNIGSIMVAANFLIIKLALETGYTQGDFSNSNIFFKTLRPDEPSYFPEINKLENIKKYRPIFIDFGNAKKIESIVGDTQTLCSEYKYRKCLGNICLNGSIIDKNLIISSPEDYGWASGMQRKLNYRNYKQAVDTMTDLTFFKSKTILADDNENTLELVKFLNENVDGERGFMRMLIESTPPNIPQTSTQMDVSDEDTNEDTNEVANEVTNEDAAVSAIEPDTIKNTETLGGSRRSKRKYKRKSKKIKSKKIKSKKTKKNKKNKTFKTQKLSFQFFKLCEKN
jgi:hypothetical protein